MSFEPLRHILARNFKKTSALSPDLQIARIFETSRIVLLKLWGEERAAFVEPRSFHEGILKLETTSPAAKQQLGIDARRIQNEMNRQLGEVCIRSILIQGKGF